MKQKGFAPVLAVILLLVVSIGLVFWIHQRNQSRTEQKQADEFANLPPGTYGPPMRKIDEQTLAKISIPPTPILSNDAPKELVTKIHNYLNTFSPIKFEVPNKGTLWWVSDDNWNILDNSAWGIVQEQGLTIPNFCPKQKDCLNEPIIKWLNSAVSQTFDKNSFSVDTQNSSTIDDEKNFKGKYDDILAYKKGEIRCVISIDPDGGNYNIICADGLAQAYKEQTPFLKALTAYDKSYRNSAVTITKRSGDFVRLSVGPRRTGSYVVMKLTNSIWTYVYGGQDAPECDYVYKLNIPGEIYGSCISCSDKAGTNCSRIVGTDESFPLKMLQLSNAQSLWNPQLSTTDSNRTISVSDHQGSSSHFVAKIGILDSNKKLLYLLEARLSWFAGSSWFPTAQMGFLPNDLNIFYLYNYNYTDEPVACKLYFMDLTNPNRKTQLVVGPVETWHKEMPEPICPEAQFNFYKSTFNKLDVRVSLKNNGEFGPEKSID